MTEQAESQLPQWAIDGLTEAGLSLEGWIPGYEWHGSKCVDIDYEVHFERREHTTIGVSCKGYICFDQMKQKAYVSDKAFPIPVAFIVASRLSDVLTGPMQEPQPKMTDPQPTGITEEELQEMERFVDNDCSDGGWAWNDKMTRLIAEVRRQRAELATRPKIMEGKDGKPYIL
jgi:hypothetical protein